jgi:hypothetical protein
MRAIQRTLPIYGGADRGLSASDLASSVYGPDPTSAQLASVTRAVRRLIQLGRAQRISVSGLPMYFRAPDQKDEPYKRWKSAYPAEAQELERIGNEDGHPDRVAAWRRRFPDAARMHMRLVVQRDEITGDLPVVVPGERPYET